MFQMYLHPSPLLHHPILYHLCPVQSGTPSHLATSWCNALPFDLVSSSDLLSIFKVRLKTFSVLVIFYFISVCVWCSDTCESCFYKPVIFIPAFCSGKVSWACVLLIKNVVIYMFGANVYFYQRLCCFCIWDSMAMNLLCSFFFSRKEF